MIEIKHIESNAHCQICNSLIQKSDLRLRCVVAGTHSESVCMACLKEFGDEESPAYCDNPSCLKHNCDGDHGDEQSPARSKELKGGSKKRWNSQ
jgi:hypothetical protein